ncbi:MAG: hypothetical protein MUP04_07400 [Anaerolineae bacterium]|nr:hypothetical protein [Anaerolineae bacterium]
MKHYLRYLFLLSGFGIFISGVYFWGVCPFINAFFPSIQFWDPPQVVLLTAAGGDIVTGMAIFAFGLLTIKEPFRRAYLKWIAALALLAVVFDLLGGLYALSAQLGLYLSLALLRKKSDERDLP